jgi:hypothetical protein
VPCQQDSSQRAGTDATDEAGARQQAVGTEGGPAVLAGLRRIVQLHGGAIAVESREGLGSIFAVRLPLTGSGQQSVQDSWRSGELWVSMRGTRDSPRVVDGLARGCAGAKP